MDEAYLHCKKTPARMPRTIAQPPGETSSTASSSSETRITSIMRNSCECRPKKPFPCHVSCPSRDLRPTQEVCSLTEPQAQPQPVSRRQISPSRTHSSGTRPGAPRRPERMSLPEPARRGPCSPRRSRHCDHQRHEEGPEVGPDQWLHRLRPRTRHPGDPRRLRRPALTLRS